MCRKSRNYPFVTVSSSKKGDKFVCRGRGMRTPYLLYMMEKVYQFSVSCKKDKDYSAKTGLTIRCII